MGVLSNEVVGLAAKVNKVMEAAGRLVAPVDDIRHIRGEDKGGTVPGPRGTYREKVNMEEEAHLGGYSGDGSPHPSSPMQTWVDGACSVFFFYLT